MQETKDNQVKGLLEDISMIKAAINRNKPVLQQIINLRLFRWFLLCVSLSIIGFSMLIYFLTQFYGDFGAMPNLIKYVFYVAITIDAIILQIWKGKAYTASAKQIDSSLTLRWLLKEFYSSNIAQIYISHLLLLIFLGIFFIVRDIPYYIIPTYSIITALITINYSIILHIRRTLIVGYWLLISGFITIVFNSIPAPIALSLTFGCGMLILSIIGFFSPRPQQED